MTQPRTGMILLIALILAAFGVWAAVFDIDQSVRAQGQVIPSSRTQILQAADGGVVKSMRVAEGQRVQQGELLAVLEKDRAQAAVDESQSKLAAHRIALIRLTAEAADTLPNFPAQLAAAWPQFVMAQRGLYAQRKSALSSELAQLDEAIAMTRQELAMHQRLLATGDVAQIEVMRIERQIIELVAKQRATQDKYKTEARTEIAKLEEERESARHSLSDRTSVLDHTEITAPMAGIVKQIRLTTEGGVLRPGDELMQISPLDEELLIELKINPADIGQLKLGLPLTLRLDAFDSAIFGTLAGTLTYLSPDTLTEQGADGKLQIYYRARARVEWAGSNADSKANNTPSPRIRPADIKPGMTATVDIRTGTRSVLKYLLKPINRAFSGALSER